MHVLARLDSRPSYSETVLTATLCAQNGGTEDTEMALKTRMSAGIRHTVRPHHDLEMPLRQVLLLSRCQYQA